MTGRVLNALITAMVALALFVSTARAADYAATLSQEPVEIVRQAAGKILGDLDQNREQFTAQPQLLRDVVRSDLLPLLDLEYSARLILGKAARGISQEQLSAFSTAMSDVLINRYADGLLEFRSHDQLEVMPMKGDNNDKLTRVRTRVKLNNGGFAPVDYAFHKTTEGWKAFDVTVEGISYVITFRDQIVPRVQSEGIDKVTADIQAGNLKLND
jgi:phospholipid transport system substrate-binding protein